MKSVRDWTDPTFQANSVTRVILAGYVSVNTSKRALCKVDNVQIP
jgi:hypothetical protein